MNCHGAARLAMTQEEVISPRLCHCAPDQSLRHPSVIARNEAIHRPSRKDMDCHGAARLAMTKAKVFTLSHGPDRAL
jgi:hypothetical protein